MSHARRASEWLPILATAFPQTFFADPAQVRPLKINIRDDLLVALPEGITPSQIKQFLGWYANRPAYLKGLLHGKGRIDLTGAVVDAEIPAEIREQARGRWLQLRAAKQNANRIGTRSTAKLGQPRTAAPLPPLDLKELYAMAIDAKLEVTLKFSALPNARPAGQSKMAFALKTSDGQFVTVAVPNKAWNKLVQANTDWPSWIAALTGTMGERTDKGFTLVGPGLQVFERKPKDTAAASAPIDTPPAPPAEPIVPPVPAAPAATVVTKAGTATVTVAKRAPLTLKR